MLRKLNVFWMSAAFILSTAVFTAASSAAATPKIAFGTSDQVLAMFYKTYRPVYPYEARRNNMEGRGLFRMYINEEGTVTSVGVLVSTGYTLLDLNASNGLIHWKAKPGHRREVDIPVSFTLHPASYPSRHTQYGPRS
jgi:TonB family protein